MDLPLEDKVEIGLSINITDPLEIRSTVEALERLQFDSLWVGDHVAFTLPMLDPLVQLTYAAAYSKTLKLGTGVYLLPLRHPAPVAKQAASVDFLSQGRLIFGVGIGGEFPIEYELCEVPHNERGARLSEGLEILKRLWDGKTEAFEGRHYRLPEVEMTPAPHQPGGPPIWCGGRSEPALRRAAEMTDGWIAYVVTPEMYRSSLETIARHYRGGEHHRYRFATDRFATDRFATGHVLFIRMDDSYEAAYDYANASLSHRYAMDFSRATKRYVALGTPSDVAENMSQFIDAGVRHFACEILCEPEARLDALEQLASEVRPLVA
ncbi:MAG: TIGR03619 family F420-dependent LLM class oxidoreductase [Pseudomonadota bacterium]